MGEVVEIVGYEEEGEKRRNTLRKMDGKSF